MEGAPEQSPNEERPTPEGLAAETWVTPWRDELVEAGGFGPRSMYVEVCWLPILGPTATWLYRRLGSWAEFNPEGLTVDMTDLAVSLGLGEGLATRSPLGRAVERLVHFDSARWAGAELQVRTALGPLPARLARRLSYSSFRMHEGMLRRPKATLSGRSS